MNEYSTETSPQALVFIPLPLTQCIWGAGDTAHWSSVEGRQLWPTTAAHRWFWTDFSPLFISKANSSSLFPRLLPFYSVTGYKWKQQGHSKLYFQSSLEVIQTEMLNRPCICPSKAGRIKLPFVFTTAAAEPLSHSQQPIYGPSEAAKRTQLCSPWLYPADPSRHMPHPTAIHHVWSPRSVGVR